MRLVLAATFICGSFLILIMALAWLLPQLPPSLAPLVGIGLAVVFLVFCVLAGIVFNLPMKSFTLSKFFGFWKKRPWPKTIDDPVFGSLKPSETYAAGLYLWVGEVAFAPVGKTVYIHVEADANGPTEKQRQFYHQIVSQFPILIADVYEALEDEVRSLIEDETDPLTEQDVRFTLDGLSIRPIEEESVNWSLAFGWTPDGEWGFEVRMHGWTVQGVGVSH